MKPNTVRQINSLVSVRQDTIQRKGKPSGLASSTKSNCLERSGTRRERTASREWTASRKAEWRALSTTRHWTASCKRRRVRTIAGSRWLCWPRLVMVPWLVRALATRSFKSLFDVELFYIEGGRGKDRKSVRCCTGWDEACWESSCREDGATADACWASEDGPIVRARAVRAVGRAVRWTFEWRRGKSAAGGDEDREAYETNSAVRRHDLEPVESCWF
jgi:hypothetical protein